MLSRMYQEGYPVPFGFVILSLAFHENGTLKEEAWKDTRAAINLLRKKHRNAKFAVRSSALSEDSAQASYAGEFETALNVESDEDVYKAIHKVSDSLNSERVEVYSRVQGMFEVHKIAVVVQLMISSDISGVLFTVDPVTGNHGRMTGNYIYGLGEQLVSGESDAQEFTLIKPKGKYLGPSDLC